MAMLVNLTAVKFCAFCKYWWDPACQYIKPNINTQWYLEPSGRCRCIKRGTDTSANQTCQNFKCNIDLK